jgi:hypothetical protein
MASAKISIPIEEFADLMTQLGPRVLVGIQNGLLSAAQRARVLVTEATRAAPSAHPDGIGSGGAVNTGAFLRAWKSEVIVGNAVRVYNQAPYAGVIEYGRRPNSKSPPFGAIALWAQRRLNLPYEEAARIAPYIARKIGKRGLKGRYILTSPEMGVRMRQMFYEEVRAEMLAALEAMR